MSNREVIFQKDQLGNNWLYHRYYNYNGDELVKELNRLQTLIESDDVKMNWVYAYKRELEEAIDKLIEDELLGEDSDEISRSSNMENARGL